MPFTYTAALARTGSSPAGLSQGNKLRCLLGLMSWGGEAAFCTPGHFIVLCLLVLLASLRVWGSLLIQGMKKKHKTRFTDPPGQVGARHCCSALGLICLYSLAMFRLVPGEKKTKTGNSLSVFFPALFSSAQAMSYSASGIKSLCQIKRQNITRTFLLLLFWSCSNAVKGLEKHSWCREVQRMSLCLGTARGWWRHIDLEGNRLCHGFRRICPTVWCFSIHSRIAGRCCDATAGFPLPGQHPDPSHPTLGCLCRPFPRLGLAPTQNRYRRCSSWGWLSRLHHRLAQILKQIQLLSKLCRVGVLDIAVPPLHVVTWESFGGQLV